jgi:hypothetical protein
MLTDSLNKSDQELINKEENKNSHENENTITESDHILKINTVLIKPEEVKVYGNRLIEDCIFFNKY